MFTLTIIESWIFIQSPFLTLHSQSSQGTCGYCPWSYTALCPVARISMYMARWGRWMAALVLVEKMILSWRSEISTESVCTTLPSVRKVWAWVARWNLTRWDITWENIISYHIVSYRIVSYRIISYHIISYHIVSYRIVSYRIVSYHIISYIISYRIVSYRIVSYHIISYHISYHIISYRIVSYHIIYHVVSYRIVSYCTVSYRIIAYHITSYRIIWYIVSYRPSIFAGFCKDTLVCYCIQRNVGRFLYTLMILWSTHRALRLILDPRQ